MFIPIRSPQDLGLAVRAARKSGGTRIDDLAGMAGVSKQFATDLEHGKPTLRLGLALKVLEELGVGLHLDLPDDAADDFEALRAKGLRPLKRAARKPAP